MEVVRRDENKRYLWRFSQNNNSETADPDSLFGELIR